MKQIIFGIFIILSAFVSSAQAQAPQFEKGIKLAQSGEYETALVAFKTALVFSENEKSEDEFRARIHYNIGVCLYRLGRSREAVGAFEQAINLGAGNYEKVFYALGMAQSDLRAWQKAERAFLEAIRLNPKNGETWFDLAFVYLARNETDAARLAFQKSIEYKSIDSATGHNNLGVLFAIGGDLASAVREFETAIKKSGGKLIEAERNLKFCKTQGFNEPAKLKFSNF